MKNSYKYIDLFSGAGGFSLGFDRAGFKNVFSVEINTSFSNTYKYNFPKHTVIEKDISEISNIEISKYGKSGVDVIIGGPPCQGFSIAGNIGRKFLDDDRNRLFMEFVRFVNFLKPRIFVLENVARIATHNKGKTLMEIICEFEKLGYNCQYEIIDTSNYGIPQVRRRFFLIGTFGKGTFTFPNKSDKKVTVKDAIGNLPSLLNGEKSNLPNHIAMNHTEQMLLKMSHINDGGDRSSIPLEIRPKSGDVRKYIKYDSKQPSICVTGDMRKVFHYNQNRALSGRELARLQTFPDDFIFKGSSISIQQQIGNAVPPKFAELIAKKVRSYLDE